MKITPRKTFLPLVKPVFGREEKAEIIDTLNSGWITLGPKTQKFEQALADYIGVKYVIALNSCSAALHLSLFALNLKPDDEVITTTFTFAATIHAITHCGAKPILVDIDENTFNIDSKKIEKAITKKTRVILPIHYGGLPADLDSIKRLAKKNNLFLVEDAAAAIGAKYKGKFLGITSDLACFSFHPVKNITTGDGGAITTNNKKLADRLMVLRVNGMDKESWKRNTKTGSWDYLINSTGFKYHMNDLQASLGIHQLKKLEKFISIRSQIANIYDQELDKISEITLQPHLPKVRNVHNIYPILIDFKKLKISRNDYINKLREYNVGSNVFFRPLHLQPYFLKSLGYKAGDFPIAEKIFQNLICLPIFPGMTTKDTLYVSDLVKHLIEQNRRK